jgi:hypothetical protein
MPLDASKIDAANNAECFLMACPLCRPHKQQISKACVPPKCSVMQNIFRKFRKLICVVCMSGGNKN